MRGREARIQHGRQRAARRVELRAQLVRAGHGSLRKPADELPGTQFMRGIAHREVRRDGIGLDTRLEFVDRGLHGALIERRRLLARRAVAAGDAHERRRRGGLMPERSTIASSKPMSRVQTGLKRFSTTALVASVVDTETRLTSERCAPAGRLSSTARMALADADRKIPRGGERLGARDDAPPVGQQHRVGESAAGIETEPIARRADIRICVQSAHVITRALD